VTRRARPGSCMAGAPATGEDGGRAPAGAVQPRTSEDHLEFRVGVEEEYQLVDAVTGALRSRARDVLELDWTSEIKGELHETTLEIGTRICSSAAEVTAELDRLRFQVGTAAAAEGLRIVAAGLHPFSGWLGQRPHEGERYARILERFGRVARDEHIFGMHIHVEVPGDDERIRIFDALRAHLPLILALSCSSPFFEAEDTGYDSYRSILWRRWPNSGIPPAFGSAAGFRGFMELLLRSGAILDERNVYWSLRPHPEYPTLEFRIADVCPRLEDAVAIAALARALVAAIADGRVPAASERLSASAAQECLRMNEWRAAHRGIDGELIDPAEPGGSVPVRTAILRLVERVLPTAEALGDGAALAGIGRLLERGNGATRMRRVFAEREGLAPLVEWVAAETMLGTGLDRRTDQREETAA
jgi:glutamate---cysteine ligase / carboxylate-amine ligase